MLTLFNNYTIGDSYRSGNVDHKNEKHTGFRTVKELTERYVRYFDEWKLKDDWALSFCFMKMFERISLNC